MSVKTNEKSNGTVEASAPAQAEQPPTGNVFSTEDGKLSVAWGLLGALAYYYRFRLIAVGITILFALWYFWPRYGAAPMLAPAYSAMSYAPALTAPAPTPVAAAPATGVPVFGSASFVVQKVTRTPKGVWLNSMSDYKNAMNQSIYLSGAAAGVNEAALHGRSVFANGKVTKGKYGNFVLVESPSELKVQ